MLLIRLWRARDPIIVVVWSLNYLLLLFELRSSELLIVLILKLVIIHQLFIWQVMKILCRQFLNVVCLFLAKLVPKEAYNACGKRNFFENWRIVLEMIPNLKRKNNLSGNKPTKCYACHVDILLIRNKFIDFSLVEDSLVVSLYVFSCIEHSLVSCEGLLLIDLI